MKKGFLAYIRKFIWLRDYQATIVVESDKLARLGRVKVDADNTWGIYNSILIQWEQLFALSAYADKLHKIVDAAHNITPSWRFSSAGFPKYFFTPKEEPVIGVKIVNKQHYIILSLVLRNEEPLMAYYLGQGAKIYAVAFKTDNERKFNRHLHNAIDAYLALQSGKTLDEVWFIPKKVVIDLQNRTVTTV